MGHCMGTFELLTNHTLVIPGTLFIPKYFDLDLPKHVVHSVARFRLRVHTLNAEQASWDDINYDVQDEQHALFKSAHPQVCLSGINLLPCSLRHKYASLFSGPPLFLSHPSSQMAPYLSAIHHAQFFQMLTSIDQNNNKLKLYPFPLTCSHFKSRDIDFGRSIHLLVTGVTKEDSK
eukprot:1159070-Pelagomonas_calceolata.AAC.18